MRHLEDNENQTPCISKASTAGRSVAAKRLLSRSHPSIESSSGQRRRRCQPNARTDSTICPRRTLFDARAAARWLFNARRPSATPRGQTEHDVLGFRRVQLQLVTALATTCHGPCHRRRTAKLWLHFLSLTEPYEKTLLIFRTRTRHSVAIGFARANHHRTRL